MKTLNKIQIILAVLIIIPISSIAQTITVDGLFWVITATPDAEKSSSNTFTNNRSINNLFETYNVTYYEKALPFSKTPELQKVYEVRCNCEIDSLILEIQNNYNPFFSGIKKLEYENIALYDPIDWLWISHSDDWLWHLKKNTSRSGMGYYKR